mgnify:CR=1 FL=1
MYSVEFTRTATKALARMPRNIALLIRGKILKLSADPYAPNNNVAALKGRPGYRLRVNDWRVIYELDNGRLVILVLEIGPRGDIYD